MGGGIVVSFAGYFPQLINSIVLMAPGGLYKSLPPEYHAWPVRYPWLFPPIYIKWIMRKLLNDCATPVSQDHAPTASSDLASGHKESTTKLPDVSTPLEPPIDVPGIVNWEIDHNDGFVYSVTSSIRSAPIENQHSAWRFLRSVIEGNEASKSISGLPNRLYGTKILLLIGDKDSILPKGQLCRNAQDTLGADNLKIVGFDAGHGFPITQGVKVAESMCTFWEL
jgi:pimeloyl-ACP methyl ester carboxylesterase